MTAILHNDDNDRDLKIQEKCKRVKDFEEFEDTRLNN